MGIRPSMCLVFGIDDLKTEGYRIIDSRLKVKQTDTWHEDVWEVDMINPPMQIEYYPGKPKQFWEVTQWNAEFGISSIIGFITHKLPYDSAIIRALGMLNNKFLEPGYEVLPTENYQDARARYVFQKVDILPCHFYQQGYYSDVPYWIEATQYIFNHFSLDVKPNEMKWMLYWQWS